MIPKYTKAVHPAFTGKFSEADIQKAVASRLFNLEALTRSFTFSHPPNESKRTAWQGMELKRCGMRAGEPDLILYFKGGRVVFVELKILKGKLRDTQESRLEAFKTLGFEAHVLYCATPKYAMDRVDEILRQNGVKL